MKERLGKNPYKVAISREEISLVHQVREKRGIPMQTWIRRMIREQAEKELAEQPAVPETQLAMDAIPQVHAIGVAPPLPTAEE